MRSIGGVIVLLVVLAVAGFLVLRETLGVAPVAAVAPAASGGLPTAPEQRAATAQQRAAESVSKAFDAASAARDAAEAR